VKACWRRRLALIKEARDLLKHREAMASLPSLRGHEFMMK
jgi:hypothetical protein